MKYNTKWKKCSRVLRVFLPANIIFQWLSIMHHSDFFDEEQYFTKIPMRKIVLAAIHAKHARVTTFIFITNLLFHNMYWHSRRMKSDYLPNDYQSCTTPISLTKNNISPKYQWGRFRLYYDHYYYFCGIIYLSMMLNNKTFLIQPDL